MSAKLRLALWVTFMVLLVSVMVLVFVLVINRHSLPEDPAEYLVDFVTDNANEVEFDRGTFEWDDLSLYRRGAYCAYYDADGNLLDLAVRRRDRDVDDLARHAAAKVVLDAVLHVGDGLVLRPGVERHGVVRGHGTGNGERGRALRDDPQ